MSDPTHGQGPEPMPVELARRLLQLLSSDDDYRANFHRDPVAALAQIGYTDATAGQCMSFSDGATLASKESISSASTRLESMLVSRFAFEGGQALSGD